MGYRYCSRIVAANTAQPIAEIVVLDQVEAVLAVITEKDEAENYKRSDAARTAAGHALVGIFGRYDVGGDVLAGLIAVVLSDSALSVRTVAAQAAGMARLSDGDRAGLVGDI